MIKKQIEDLIKESGKTLYELDKDTGIGKSQLYRIFHGNQSLTDKNIDKILKALNISANFKNGGEK